jgi:cysteinyl-tRNA synthetase
LLDEFIAQNPTVTPEVLETAGKAWDAYFTKNAAKDPQDAGTTPATFADWAQYKHGVLMDLIAKEAAPKTGVEEEVILDEATTKLKMHLNTLLTASRAMASPPSAEEFYAATASIFLPYLDSLHKSREFEPAVFSKLSSYWERHFNEDMATLNVLPPTVVTRVSEFIPENVTFVQKLVDKGFAYPTADGSVYFDIAAYEAAGHHYAKLQPWNRGDQSLIADGEGALTSDKASTIPNTVNTELPQSKKSAQDFALWKASKAGEPAWDSPWGKGRPGWHIECSVMCSEVLGQQVDIHSGGIDLAFPHHDNEIAQSEAYWDGCEGHTHTVDGKHQWINYFLHMGHLQIHGSKMSKSLKNFVSVRDALQRGGWTPRGLRIVFLLGGWKEGIEVREGVLAEAKSWEATVNKFFANVKALVAEQEAAEAAGQHVPQPFGELEKTLAEGLDRARSGLDAALCDSFNTPQAMQVILDLISATNIYMSATPSLSVVKEVARWVTRIVNMFGLDSNSSPDPIGWTTEATAAANKEEAAMPYIRLLSSFRDRVRKIAIADPKSPAAKELLALCDNLRDVELADLGVSLDDRESDKGRPALIKFVPAEELKAAREEKERKAREKEAKKEEQRRKLEEEQKKKEEAAKVDPKTMFRTNEWSEWDEDGIPTKDAKGEEVTKSRTKALKKIWDRQKKAYDAWLSKTQQDGKN